MLNKWRWRRWLRPVFYALAGLVAFAVVAIVALLIVLSTPWGKEELRSIANAQLRATLVGGGSIGRIEGSVLGDLVVHDIVINDASGNPAIVIEKARVDARLWPLLDEVLHINRLDLSGVQVSARLESGAPINLATLVVQKDDQPMALRVRIDAFTVANSSARLTLPMGSTETLESIEIESSRLLFSETGLELVLGPTSARHRERQLDIAAHASISKRDGRVALRDLSVEVAGASFHLESALLNNSKLSEVRAALTIPASSVHALVPGLPWLADVRLRVQSEGPDLQIRGVLAGALLRGHARPQLERKQVALALDVAGLDIEALWPGLPSSALSLSLTGTYGPLVSHGTLRTRGIVSGKVIDAASISLSLRGKELKAKMQAHAAGASLVVGADVELGESITINASKIEFASPDLLPLVSPMLAISGDLEAQLTAQGPLDSLLVRGSLSAGRLDAFGFYARNLMLYPDLAQRGERVVGSVHASMSSLRRGDTIVTGLRLQARSEDGRSATVALAGAGRGVGFNLNALLRLQSQSLRLQLVQARAQYKKLNIQSASGSGSWTFSGPQVGLLKIDGLQIQSNAGRLALSGEARSLGPPAARIDLDASEINLARLSRVAELRTSLVGTLSMKATIDTLDGRRGEILAHADRVAWGALPSTTGEIRLRVRGRDLIAGLKLEATNAAKLDLRAKIQAPRRPLDLSRWMNLDQRALRSFELRAEVSDASRFSHLYPELPLTGRMNLHAVQKEGESRTSVDLRASKIVVKHFSEPGRGWLHLELGGARIAGSGEVALGERVSAIFRGALHLGGPWFAGLSYRRLGVDSIESAKLATSEVDLDWLLKHFTPASAGRGALARASIAYVPTSKSFELAATVSLPRGGVQRRHVVQEATLAAALEEHHGEAGIVASMASKIRIEGRGDFDLGWRDLMAGHRDLREVMARASLAITDLPLRSLHQVLPRDLVTAASTLTGSLHGTVSFSGTALAPRLRVHASLDDAAIAGVAIASLVAEGEFNEGKIVVSAEARQAGGGSFTGRAQSDLRAKEPLPLAAQIVARNFDLAFVGQFMPNREIGGLLSADLSVSGTRSKPRVLGSLKVNNGSFNPGAPFYAVKNAEIEAELRDERIVLRAGLESGRGKATIGGAIDLQNNAPVALKLTISTEDLPINASALLVRLDSRTTVLGRYQGEGWRVSANIERATLTLSDALSRTLHPVELPSDLIFADEIKINKGHPSLPSMPAAIELAIRSKNNIRVKGGGVDALVGASLDVHLDEELRVNGEVHVEQGRIELIGRRYQIRSAQATFAGGLDPLLQVELAHDFDALTLIIEVVGLASHPRVAFRSDPPRYDTAELLAFVLGASPDDSTTEGRSTAQEATGLATRLLAGELSRIVTNVVPIDILRIDTDDSSAERVALGKWLTDKLLIGYRHRFTADPTTNTDELIFEYRFLERWLLEGFIGQQVIGADLLWIRRY